MCFLEAGNTKVFFEKIYIKAFKPFEFVRALGLSSKTVKIISTESRNIYMRSMRKSKIGALLQCYRDSLSLRSSPSAPSSSSL